MVTSVNVDTNQSDKLLRLLDTAVIKLEGGTDEDLKVLDEKPNIDTKPEIVKEPTPASNATSAEITNSKPDETDINSKSDEEGEMIENDENGDTEMPIVDAQLKSNADETVEGEQVSKKRKRTTSGSSSSSSSSGKFRDFKYIWKISENELYGCRGLLLQMKMVKKTISQRRSNQVIWTS